MNSFSTKTCAFLSLLSPLFFLSIPLHSAQSVFCPQNNGYASIGMTQAQVLSSCGQPLSRQQSKSPLMEKVPVQQFIYNNQGAQKGFYGYWQTPVSMSGAIAGGATLQINLIDNKVTSVQMNGSNLNAVSLCNGRNVQIGDLANIVYSACGRPTMINNTYILKPVISQTRPEVWIYQRGEYQQAPIILTFVDGKLQSINQ